MFIGSTMVKDPATPNLGAMILQNCMKRSPCPAPKGKPRTGALLLIVSSAMANDPEISKHLDELRKRILRIALVVGIITIFILTFHLTPIEFGQTTLYYPTPDPLHNIAAQITNFMKDNLVPPEVQLIQTAPGQAFFAQVYIAAIVGIVLGMPVIVKELAGFIKPALKEREINVSRSIVIPAIGLFAGGCFFSYYLVIPYILEFLYRYGESA